MTRPSGDNDGSNSSHGRWVTRVRPVPSALMDQTAWELSKTIRPESEVDPSPLPHAPTTRTMAREVAKTRDQLMPFLHPAWPGSSRPSGEIQLTGRGKRRLLSGRCFAAGCRTK